MDIRIKQIFNHWLHFNHRVMEFEWLFNEEQCLAELRNELLPDFFNDLNNLYWENILMTIARLFDNHKQGQNINLSLFTLVEILKEKDKTEWEIVEDKLKKLKSKHSDIIKYRQKHLAHYDFDYSIGAKVFNGSIHIAEIHIFLDSMLDIINTTLKALGENPQSGTIIRHGRYKGAHELIRILKNEKRIS